MMRENVTTRGRRLVSEGRLIVSYVSGRSIAAVCRGDSGEIHRLGHDPGRGYWCACQAKTVCAHQRALMLVTLRPTIGAAP